MRGDAPIRVLIVENDFTIAENIYNYLEFKGFAPDAAYDGHAALALSANARFDAVILDIGLPGLDGYGVLQQLRQVQGPYLPILMLTARAQLDDKLTAFSLGADDYLVKPFALAELEARLRAMVRRAQGPASEPVLQFHGLIFDTASGSATVNGRELRLARKSRIILQMLLKQPTALVTRQELEHALWGDQAPSDEAVRSQIHILRKALAASGFDGIQTVHALGWRLIAPEG
jgi:DNA-binding response OmpR family regulator